MLAEDLETLADCFERMVRYERERDGITVLLDVENIALNAAVIRRAAERERELEAENERLKQPWIDTSERVAQLVAHRACIGAEHDPERGKLHGYCVVCGVPWPCEIAKPRATPPEPPRNVR